MCGIIAAASNRNVGKLLVKAFIKWNTVAMTLQGLLYIARQDCTPKDPW